MKKHYTMWDNFSSGDFANNAACGFAVFFLGPVMFVGYVCQDIEWMRRYIAMTILGGIGIFAVVLLVHAIVAWAFERSSQD